MIVRDFRFCFIKKKKQRYFSCTLLLLCLCLSRTKLIARQATSKARNISSFKHICLERNYSAIRVMKTSMTFSLSCNLENKEMFTCSNGRPNTGRIDNLGVMIFFLAFMCVCACVGVCVFVCMCVLKIIVNTQERYRFILILQSSTN